LGRRIPANKGKILPEPRLRWAVRWLTRLRPEGRVDLDQVPDSFLQTCLGKAERLRDNRLFRPYAEDYLM
jgi:hypothetical protein